MADKFLNLSGLAYLWGLVKSYISSENKVFNAVYGTTTYQELYSAMRANKTIVISGSQFELATGLDKAYISSYVRTTSKGIEMTFIHSSSTFESTIYCVSVDTNNQWSIDSFSNATDSTLGFVKTNSAESITLNSNGQLNVGGRLGQFQSGGVYYPTTIEPTNVGSSTFLMSDGAKGLSLSGRNFGIMAGANLTCKSASAGATQYRLSNTQANRFSCFAGKGGRLALNQTDASTNGTALITNISFANGNPISAYFGPTESDNDIIITVDRTVNPSASTTTLRIYGTSTSNDVIVVGQGCGAAGGKAISLGQSCFVGGNQCIAFGNSSISTGNNSVAFGHTHLVNKQFCFAAGQGHDFTNGSNGAAAVGIASKISSDTAFAVGNGTFNGNGNITRSNAFEVTKDSGVILKSPNGIRWKITVSDAGAITATAV